MWTIRNIDAGKSIYLAVVDAIEQDVRSGVLRPGEQMPTHRKLAEMIGVTVGTVTRAYKEATVRGLVTATVGRGTFVPVDAGQKPTFLYGNQSTKSPTLWGMRPLNKGEPQLSAVARKTISKRKSTVLTYSDPQGLIEHRGVASDWLSRFGLNVPPKNIVITAGAQHALFLICNCLFRSGERLATDRLTYQGLKAATQRNNIRLDGLEFDKYGMLPSELDSLCSRQSIRAVYVSGRVQYPTNRGMSAERRAELAKVIRRHNLLLIENDSYGCMCDNPADNLSALLPGHSIYISSLSKAFLAGLRIAYVAASGNVVQELTRGITDHMLCVSPLCAGIAADTIAGGHADRTIAQKKRLIAKRVEIFKKLFAGHEFRCNAHSLSAWLYLRSMKGADLEAEAARRNIGVFSSERFAVGAIPVPEAVQIPLTGAEELFSLRSALQTVERLISKHPSRR